MTRIILSISTYPTRLARQGGQKRIAAFRTAYKAAGYDLQTAALFDRPPYGPDETGPYDIEHPATHSDIPHIRDLSAGRFAATNEDAFAHFARVLDTLKPAALQLEQPFLWPLAERLLRETAPGMPLIYASQNWEAPLKAEILRREGVAPDMTARIAGEIEALEAAATRAAALVIAVSDADAAHCLPCARPGTPVVTVPNAATPPRDTIGDAELAGRKYALTVGSAYAPNVEGAARYVFEPGLWFMPPEPSLAICGGMAYGVFETDAYHAFGAAHDARTVFRPSPTDAELAGLIASAHMILLPIGFGGGSNLKTAEALLAGAHVVATPTAMRGFEPFAQASGVHIGRTPQDFRNAMVRAWSAPSLTLSDREQRCRATLTWDHVITASGLIDHLRRVAP